MTILAPRRHDPASDEEARQLVEALIREARRLRRQRLARRMLTMSLAIVTLVAVLSVTGALGARTSRTSTASKGEPGVLVRNPAAEVVTFSRTLFSSGSGGRVANREIEVLATSLHGPQTGFYETFQTFDAPRTSTSPQLTLAVTVNDGEATSYRLPPFANLAGTTGQSPCYYSVDQVSQLCDVTGLSGMQTPASTVAGEGQGELPMLVGIPGDWYSPSKLIAGLRRIAAGPFVRLSHGSLQGIAVTEYRVPIDWNSWYRSTLVSSGPKSGWSVANQLVRNGSGMAAPTVYVWLDSLGRICKLVTPSGAARYVTTITYLRHRPDIAQGPTSA